MKRIILFFLLFILVVFLLPTIFTKSYKKAVIINEPIEQKKEEIKLNQYDYKDYSKIKLLHVETGEIEELSLDEYLLGVVSAEMPASFEQEALNAQAIVARTYTIYSIIHSNNKHEEADICDSPACCQAWISKENRLNKWDEKNREEYWNKIMIAINNTSGKIITYNGEVIDAFFHSNSGGVTESPVNVWGGTNFPYLQSVQTSGEDAYSQYNSEVNITKEEFISKIKQKYDNFEIDFSNEDCIKILEYTDSNRVKTIKVGNLNLSGVEVRSLIGLKSTNFVVNVNDDNVSFKVIGYGHGVGMSQTGADSMAKNGKNYEDIIKHFYTGVEITNM